MDNSRNLTRWTAALPALAAAGLIDLGTITPAHAQAVLEEVIVVARKREESLQQTPIAVTALGTEALREAQINNVGDLIREAPGLTRREGRKTADLAIRGIGTRVSAINAEPGVGVYVDQIYIPRNDAQLVDVANMESIQVLRGPQGTLFGKNTIGGAILLTRKKPDTGAVQGAVEARLGNLDRQDLRFNISGPLIENRLAGGILIDSRQQEGYREDADTGRDYGDVDRQSVMAQLRVQSDDIFTGDLMLFWGKTEENIEPYSCLLVNPTALQTFVAPGNTNAYADECNRSWDLLDDEKVLMDRSPLDFEVENQMAGLKLTWELDDFTVKSITGYLYQSDITTSGDTDASSIFSIQNQYEPRRQMLANGIDADDQTRKFFSQEFQFVGDAFDDFLGYTVGVFYSSEKIEKDGFGNMLGPGGFLGSVRPDGNISVLPPAAVGFREATIRDFENTSAAIFGQAILNFSDNWQATLGARYNWDEKKVSQDNYTTAASSPGVLTVDEFNALEDFIHPVVPIADNPRQEGKDDWKVFNPAATLTWFLDESGDSFNGGMFYGSISEGFKAGGFAPFGTEFLAFDPEEVITAELGTKLDFWSNRIRLNGALYYSKYDDIQISVTRTFPSEDPGLPATTLNGITNAGEATIQGAELEFSVLPVEGLLLRLNASYTKAEYDEFVDEDAFGNPIDRSDEDFAFIPEWTVAAIAQHDWQTKIGSIIPRLSANYRDEVYIGLDPSSALVDEAYLESYTLWNFRLAWQSSTAEGLELAGFVNNLTEEEYFGTGISSVEGVGALTLVPGMQRTYGVEFRYSW